MGVVDDNQFERLWLENKHRLLNADREYRDMVDSYKMNSGADWLLFGIPVVAGIASFQAFAFDNELLRWLVSAVITVVAFAISAYVKSLIVGGKPVSDIEERIKKDSYKRYCETGKI